MITFNKLFAYLAEHNISRKELAEKSGISLHRLSKLRHNKKVSTQVIETLCSTLNCSIDDIIEYNPEEI